MRDPVRIEEIVTLARMRLAQSPGRPMSRIGAAGVKPPRSAAPSAESIATTASRSSSDPRSHEPPAIEPRDEATFPPLDLRERGFTRAGGLMFLIHAMRSIDAVGALAGETIFADRSPRSVLHQLALSLLPLEPNDPAAFAFAGLGPRRGTILLREPPASPAERAVLERHAARIIGELRRRLGDETTPADKLLFSVCRRSAEVLADPAWIELRMSIDDVSHEVRRAGLDLDPGWVPWIGAVVRFVYA
jgi:hypothetical protein